MFKFFNVTEEGEKADAAPIEVNMSDDEAEDDIGQVALDILESENAIHIIAPLAGIDIDHIDISVSRNILTISGERSRPDLYADADRSLVSECFFGPFSRSVILPENLAFNKVKAAMENNLLLIEVPKLQFPSKSVKINKLES